MNLLRPVLIQEKERKSYQLIQQIEVNSVKLVENQSVDVVGKLGLISKIYLKTLNRRSINCNALWVTVIILLWTKTKKMGHQIPSAWILLKNHRYGSLTTQCSVIAKTLQGKPRVTGTVVRFKRLRNGAKIKVMISPRPKLSHQKTILEFVNFLENHQIWFYSQNSKVLFKSWLGNALKKIQLPKDRHKGS